MDYSCSIVNYIDSEVDDENLLSEIIKVSKEKDLFEFLKLLGKIACLHPHYGHRERQSERIIKILEPFIEDIRNEQLKNNGEAIKKTLLESIHKRDEILSKMDHLRKTYSYVNCGFKRITNKGSYRDGYYRSKYLFSTVVYVNIWKRRDIIQFLDKILSILDDVENEFDRINHRDEDYINSDEDYYYDSDDEQYLYNNESWNHVHDSEDEYNEEVEYEWNDKFGYLDLKHIYENDFEYPEEGEMNSCFDTLHDLLIFLDNFFQPKNKYFHIWRFMNRDYTIPMWNVNYISLYRLFKLNKRVIKYFIDKGLLFYDASYFHENEIEKIIEKDDIDSFITFTNDPNFNWEMYVKNRVIKRGRSLMPIYKFFDVFKLAIVNGSMKLFKYLLNRFKLHEEDIVYAAYSGNIEMYEYIRERVEIIYEYEIYMEDTFNYKMMKYIWDK